jgi:hypothetical protein
MKHVEYLTVWRVAVDKKDKKKNWSPNKREKNKCKKIGVYMIR